MVRTWHWVPPVGTALLLSLAWLWSHRALRQMPDDGAGFTFLRATVPPFALCFTMLIGFKWVLPFLMPDIGQGGYPFANMLFALVLVGIAGWLSLAWLQHTDALKTFIENRHDRLADTIQVLPPTRGRTFLKSSEIQDSDQSTAFSRGVVQSTLGRYQLLKELGRGAMGVVYLAQDPRLHRSVAIKTVCLDQGDGPSHSKI